MCTFLSAVYTRTGKLVCEPGFSNSHSDLLRHAGIHERNTLAPVQNYVRLELSPTRNCDDILDFSSWKEYLDERENPVWFCSAARFDAFDRMRDVLRGGLNREGEEVLFGGVAFLQKCICRIHGVYAFALSGSNVVALSGSNVIARSGSRVEARFGSDVDAFPGSDVDAHFGSNVVAHSGSTVVACSGSHVDANTGSHVIAHCSSNVLVRYGSKVDARSGSNIKTLNKLRPDD